MWGVIKRDLSEFVTTVKTETKEVVKSVVKKDENEKTGGEIKKRIQFDAKTVQEV